MATQEEREQFLNDHRLAVIATVRRDGRPQLTVVYYAWQDGRIIVSTTRSRVKARNIRRDPRVTICALEEQPNFSYQTVYGRGEILDEGAVDAMMLIGEKMLGRPIDESQRPALEERARQEGRIVLRITPEEYSP
jgi:PPOX class probable F420-dependent enzyme